MLTTIYLAGAVVVDHGPDGHGEHGERARSGHGGTRGGVTERVVRQGEGPCQSVWWRKAAALLTSEEA